MISFRQTDRSLSQYVKLTSAILVLGTLLLGFFSERFLVENLYSELTSKHRRVATQIEHNLSNAANLAARTSLDIAHNPILLRLASQQGATNPESELEQLLGAEWRAMLELHPGIQQIRFIATSGMEIYRAVRIAGEYRWVSGDDLQFKGDRYYFTLPLQSPELNYLSPIDLNQERGVVEIPYRPTIRAVSKVITDGEVRGLTVINFDLTQTFAEIEQTQSSADFWLVNQNGYFLASPNQHSWGWVLGQHEYNASSEFGNAWKSVRDDLNTGRGERFFDGHSFWSSTLDIEQISTESLLQSDPRFWLIAAVPEQVHNQALRIRISILVVCLIAVLLVLTGARGAQRLARRLVEERRRADHNAEAKAEFLAKMSHEIRTPINGISGFLQLMETEPQSKQSLSYLHEAENSLRVLTTVIDDILDFSKIEAGKLELNNAPFELDRALQTVGKIMGRAAHGKSLNLMFDFDPERPRYLRGDQVRLQQILLNLTNNAIKFTDQGEITVRVDVLGYDGDRVQLGFEVQDTGMGISQETQARLFQAFEQGSHNDLSQHGGTGLGLTISKQLITLMKGNISVESAPGKGSTFRFNIWLEVDREQESQRRQQPFADHYQAVLVTANINSAEILRRTCAVLGWHSILCRTCNELDALPKLDSSDTGRVLLIDEQFIDQDQHRAWIDDWVAAQRQDGSLSILMISHNRVGYGDAALEIHDGLIVKPFTPSTLVDTVIEAADPSEQIADAEQITGQHAPQSGLTGLHILLAEDNPVNQMVARKLLELQGAKVTVAADGRVALDKLQKAPEAYDIVFMDMQMPKMDGLEATREIRKDARFQKLPIIALTANALPQDRQRCREAGMNDHLAKPFTIDQVRDAIDRWVGPKGN